MSVNSSDAEILGLALGAPACQVLNHAEANGPKYGWKDGYLSRKHGVCSPDLDESHNSLRGSLGYVWLQACARLPALVTRGRVRQSLDAISMISGTSDTVPDTALWAAYASLQTLAASYRYEAQADPESSITGFNLPKALSLPLEQITRRLGRSSSQYGIYDMIISDYTFDNDAPARSIHNIRLRYPSFGTSTETRAVLWVARLHMTFAPAVDLMAQCQEKMLVQDIDGLVRIILDLLKVVKDLATVIKNLHLDDLLALRRHPMADLKQADAEFPELSLPVFQFLDALLGKSTHTTSHRRRMVALRHSLPINARAYIAAIESRPIGDFVAQQSHIQLSYAWRSLTQAYYDAHGLLGIYQQKAVAARRIAIRLHGSDEVGPTNSDEVSTALPARQLYEYCNVRAKVSSRSRIDSDQDRTTALVSLLMHESHGLSFEAGDRLLVMPLNSWAEVEKIAAALGLDANLDQEVPLYGGTAWDTFAQQLHADKSIGRLSVQDVLRYGQIAPLDRTQLETLDRMFHGTCALVTELLGSQSWPVLGTLGDVLQMAIEQVSPVIWDSVFDLDHLSWLAGLIPVAEPRPYGISSPALMGSSLPSSVKITVSRTSYEVDATLDDGLETTTRYGMTSRSLNPHPGDGADLDDESEYPVLIGVEPASTIRLRSTPMDNIVMFAEQSSVGLFRSFWRSRSHCLGQTILFFALHDIATYPFEAELAQLQHSGQMRVFTSATAQTEPLDSGRMLASAILDQGQLVCDLLTSTSEGGLGAHLYLSGSLKLYHSVVAGIKRALYNSDSIFLGRTAESLLAEAAGEGRLMLDIHAAPNQSLNVGRPISVSQLAHKTGHRPGLESWVAISNEVYDLTKLQRIFPADAPTIRLAAGLDGSTTLSALTASAPMMGRLLSDFRVGPLKNHRSKASGDDSALVGLWMAYLRFGIETLTTLAWETEMFRTCNADHFTTSEGREALRAFITAQGRLLQNGISSVFGVMLQEVHIRTAFAHVTKLRPDVRIPDVMGIVSRTRSPKVVAQATKELQALQRVLRSNKPTDVQKDGATQYAKAVAELELHLLETVVGDLSAGVDILEQASALNEHITAQLLSVLEHVALRYQTFWERLALESVSRSVVHKTLLRQKYDIVRKRMSHGRSAAVVIGNCTALRSISPVATFSFIDQTVNFAHLVDQAMQTVNEENLMAAYADNRKRGQGDTSRDIVALRTATKPEATAYDAMHHKKAVRALASFLGSSESAIKRLSQLPADLSFAYIMASYGRNAPNASNHARSSSAARSVLRTMDSQSGNDTPRPRLIRRRTNNSSISSAVPQSIFSSPEAASPDTTVSGTASPMPLQLTLRSRSASKVTGLPVRLSRSSSSLSYSQFPAPPTLALHSSAAPTAAPEMPPTKGTQLATLLPSPIFLEKPVQETRPATVERPARPTHWEMPIVSLCHAERQTSNRETTARPALPLQTKKTQPPTPPTAAQTSSSPPAIPESQWFGGKLSKQQQPRAFSSKELPIVTLSKQERKALSKAEEVLEPRIKKHWEMPLYSLSRAAMKATATRPGDAVRKPEVRLQAVLLPRAIPPSSSPMGLMAEPVVRPVVPFDGRHLPILTLSKSERARSARKHDDKRTQPAKHPVRKALLGPVDTHGLWLHPQRREQAQEKQMFGISKTQDYVGLWLQPQRRAQNTDFDGCLWRVRVLPPTSRRRTMQQSSLAHLNGHMLWTGLSPREARKQATTLGYVGLWMSPPSQKMNTDFQMVLSGEAVPQPMETRSKVTSEIVQASEGSVTSCGLWQSRITEQKFPSRRTVGYVGMFMKPASRKRNNDFEELRVQSNELAANAPRKIASRPIVQALEEFSPSAALWSSVLEEQTKVGLTLGSVGMWMNPPSQKINMDFEQLVINVVNYLLGSQSPLHRRMARDMQLVAAELSTGPWNLVDWTALGSVVGKSQAVARTKRPTAPVQPEPALQPPSYMGQTLGQLGMWMWPPSQRWNVDFEGFRLATAAAPELESKQRLQTREAVKIHQQYPSRSGETSKYTKGFIGLWTEPAARKVNLDFEWAKNHAEMKLDEQPVNPMLPVTLPAEHAESSMLPIPPMENYTFLAQSPSISTAQTAVMTPTSASTADGMARHTIDFEDRLRRLNAELDMEDSGADDFSGLSTPTIQEPPAPLRRNPPSAPEPSRRPELKQLDTQTPRQLNGAGLEILSTTRYTPDSSGGSASSSLLSPHSAALRPRAPVRTASQPQQQPHLWERDIGPMPSELPPAPEPAPLRTQSTRQVRPEASRVSSVKNMWEKRASLVIEQPLKIGRAGSRSPPEPLKLQRANTLAFAGGSASGRASRAGEYRRDSGQDSATVPGFEMLGSGGYRRGSGRGGEMGMESPLLSPLSPSVTAY